jgi:hypothetical protein
MADESIRCQGWTSRWEFHGNLPCGNKAQAGKQYCKIHDPELAEQRDERRNARYSRVKKAWQQ